MGPVMQPSDRELNRYLAEQVKGVAIDAQMVRSHAIQPASLTSAVSDHGSEGSRVLFEPTWPIAEPTFLNVPAFGAALGAALEGNVAGYLAQLRQNGQPILTQEWQFAKRPQDGSESWTPDVQLHVASVSKLMTAIAMTQLMGEHNISPDAQIIDYLPDYWAKGPNIEYIVFRNVLDHTSGLSEPDIMSFSVIQNAIANGVSLDLTADHHLGLYCYQNVDYALCRILLAVMNGNISKSAEFESIPWLGFGPGVFNDAIWDLVTIRSYEAYLQANVFQPSAVVGATLDHPAATGLAYAEPNDPGPGWNSGNLEEGCGPYAWHLSVDQVLDVMGEFRRGGGILTAEAALAMLENGFGIDPFVGYGCAPPGTPTPPWGLATRAGVVYCKNGEWQDRPNGRIEQALAYFLPQDMELVVLANSPVQGPRGTEFFRDVVTQAYLDNLITQWQLAP
jgi:CubicO group peptidase (beta-lactamase class C family)